VDPLLWVTIVFFDIGFVVLVSMKRNMEHKVAVLKSEPENSQSSAQPVIWWIVGTTVWGMLSMGLFMWWFSVNMT
jgi:hypothetical protein